MKRLVTWFGLALPVLAVSSYGIARSGLKDLDAVVLQLFDGHTGLVALHVGDMADEIFLDRCRERRGGWRGV